MFQRTPEKNEEKYLSFMQVIRDLYLCYIKNLQLNNKKTNSQLKYRQTIWIDISPNKRHKHQKAKGKLLNIISYQGSTNQNHNVIPFHTNKDGYQPKVQIITNVDQDVEKWNPHALLVEVKWYSCFRKQSGSSSKD